MDAKPAQEAARVSATVPFLIVALAFPTFNTISSVIGGRKDFWTIFSIASLYVLVLLLFLSIYIAHHMPIDSLNRARLSLPVWVILTSIFMLIAYRTSAVLSPAFAWVMWVQALFSSGVFFWVLFSERPRDDRSGCAVDCAEDKPEHAQKSPPTVADNV